MILLIQYDETGRAYYFGSCASEPEAETATKAKNLDADSTYFVDVDDDFEPDLGAYNRIFNLPESK